MICGRSNCSRKDDDVVKSQGDLCQRTKDIPKSVGNSLVADDFTMDGLSYVMNIADVFTKQTQLH